MFEHGRLVAKAVDREQHQWFDVAAGAELDAHDGTTLAVDATGVVQGFTTWDRGVGYDANAVLTVHDLVGLTADATTALLANLASWASVTPTCTCGYRSPIRQRCWPASPGRGCSLRTPG